MENTQQFAQGIMDNVATVIVGKPEAIREIVIGLLCRGHVLIEDVPGTGKTVLAKSLARSIGCTFSRIQFTPDMLPSDVTGVSIYNQKTQEFEFRPGPIMAQIVLTDEINRATPKTQSALLEAMEEHQVTVDGVTYAVPEPFMVLATQNPIEYEGTFPLPEAQMDRFLMRISLGYPSHRYEIEMVEDQQIRHPLESLGQVASADDLVAAQWAIREVEVAPELKEYIVNLVSATRSHAELYLGSSPRGSLALFRTAQALAATEGRRFVIPDDIKAMAVSTLAHRVIVGSAARIGELEPRQLIREILNSVPAPGGEIS